MPHNKILPVDFLCIGAQKSATSWLNEVLKMHPDIWLPPVKELHYFDHLFVEENRAWTKHHIQSGVRNALYWYINSADSGSNVSLDHAKYLLSIDSEKVFSEEWYNLVYSRPAAKNRVKGDITPEYSTIPDHGVKYIADNAKSDLKVIYIIRQPVDRALSQLRMNVARSGIDFNQLSEEDWLRVYEKNYEVLQNRGNYKEYIPRWKHHFSDENILFLDYELIKKNPESALNEVTDLLEIESGKIDQSIINRKVHVTKKVTIPEFIQDKISEDMTEQSNFLTNELFC